MLPGVEATRLDGVASRLGPIDLEIMIRNPRFVKRDTSMPSLFAGPDRDLAEVEALKHYLSTLNAKIPEYPVGDIERGRGLYHRIGCAACHAPEVGYRPEGIPENAEIELAGLPSVPMNLADLYDIGALTHFLLTPNEHRPSGRMPDFRLTVAEASDLAAYLKAGPDLVLPENLQEALTEGRSFVRDENLVKRGRALFEAKNCTACHSVPGGNGKLSPQRARPLADLPRDSRKGCLSERPVGGAVPFFGLDEVQKRAISATLARLEDRARPDLAGEIDWRMKRLNCYACHERGGVGGPETAREVYFGFGSEKSIALGRWGHLPPSLDRIGAKLTPGWTKRVLLGDPKGGYVRDYLPARMPLYRKEEAAPLVKQFAKLDFVEVVGVPGVSRSAERGGILFSTEGEDCGKCHGVGSTRSREYPGIDLGLVKDRLQQPWFEYLLTAPYTGHPPGLAAEPAASSRPLTPDKAGDLWKWLISQTR
jgi:mono/diheme cytochrome c family protein